MASPESEMTGQLSQELDTRVGGKDEAGDVAQELEPKISDEEMGLKTPAQDDSASTISADNSNAADEDIAWHYLTFDTPLPLAARIQQEQFTTDKRAPPPECPDLTPFRNPFFWSRGRKLFMSWFGCISTMIIAYSAGAYASGEAQMTKEFHVSEPAFEVGITVFTCGFAVAPMVLAPFSEINGRRPVFLVTGALYMLFQLTCALVPNFGGMLAARFLAGCCASSFSTMVGGVIADFYNAADRNWAMAVFAGGAIFGTGLGPLCSGFIAQNLNWRWIFRVQVISNFLLLVVIVLFFKESRGSILLSRKAKALNQWYEELESLGYGGVLMPSGSEGEKSSTTRPQRIRWKVKADEERATLVKMISISLVRPFQLLVTEPVVFFFSLWITFAWSCLYLLFSAIPVIFSTRYGFNIAQVGAVFSCVSIAAVLSTIIAVYGEQLAKKHCPEKWRPWLSTPEGRLLFCCVQSALLPIGSFWYGWTSFSDIHWIVPTLGIGCATMGVYSVYLAVFNYLADIYHSYASSALAAQSFCRNMAAGAFPVFVAQMFHTLTYQGAGSLLGGVSLLLTIVPWILVFKGPAIRARSKIARQLLEDSKGA